MGRIKAYFYSVTHLSRGPRREYRFPLHCCLLGICCLAMDVVYSFCVLQYLVPISQPRGRAIAEAVSRWLPTAAARVRVRAWQVGFVVDKVASGQVFSEHFGFPCQNCLFHKLLHHHNHPGQLEEALRQADHLSKESCRLS
jgi:hypothetical protein